MLSACSTKNIEKTKLNENNQTMSNYAVLGIENNTSNIITQEPKESTELATVNYDEPHGEFQGNNKLLEFIEMMHLQHGFERNRLNEIFSQAQNYTLIPQNRSRPSQRDYSNLGKWDRYRNIFIYEKNIQRGVDFWQKHQDALRRATEEYGIPAEYIVGIIGIETAFGVNFGKRRVIDVLTTKSMLNHRRASFYTSQLESFLVMTRQAGLDPTELMGSSAGAMGYGQFIASSYLDFAVDFNGDGITDLWNAEDAIGSIANYFSRNGWKRGLNQVAVRAKYRGSRFKKLKTGYKTRYSQHKLKRRHNIKPRAKMECKGSVCLVRLNRAKYDELWLGTHNFRVITTYNHSTHYAMAVHQLAKAIKARVGF